MAGETADYILYQEDRSGLLPSGPDPFPLIQVQESQQLPHISMRAMILE